MILSLPYNHLRPMGNLPASLQEERRLKTCLNGKSTRVSAREPHPGLGNQPATQRAPQAEDPWFWKSACVTQGFRQAEDPSLTNATTSYTVSVRILKAAASPNKHKPFVNQMEMYL